MAYYTALVAVSLITSALLLLRRYMRGGVYSGGERLDGRTVVITGASDGLGKATAQELAARGGHVVMACRDLNKAKAALKDIRDVLSKTTSGTLEVIKLDLASFESIREFSEEVNSKFEKIDILINNAGVVMQSRKQTKDGLEFTIGVCHFGHFMLTNLLLNKLKKSDQGRVITLASGGHDRGHMDFEDLHWEKKKFISMGAYGQAKLANILCTRELSKRLKGTKVTANCVHPGVIVTHIARDIPFMNTFVMKAIFFLIQPFVFKTVQEGIQTTLRLAVDPSLSGVSGKYFSDCVEKKPLPRAMDDVAALRLWEISEEVTNTTVE